MQVSRVSSQTMSLFLLRTPNFSMILDIAASKQRILQRNCLKVKVVKIHPIKTLRDFLKREIRILLRIKEQNQIV
jgi:hypothetical protein